MERPHRLECDIKLLPVHIVPEEVGAVRLAVLACVDLGIGPLKLGVLQVVGCWEQFRLKKRGMAVNKVEKLVPCCDLGKLVRRKARRHIRIGHACGLSVGNSVGESCLL